MHVFKSVQMQGFQIGFRVADTLVKQLEPKSNLYVPVLHTLKGLAHCEGMIRHIKGFGINNRVGVL